MGTGTFYIFTDFLIDFLFIRRICRPIRVANGAHSPLPGIPYSVLVVVCWERICRHRISRAMHCLHLHSQHVTILEFGITLSWSRVLASKAPCFRSKNSPFGRQGVQFLQSRELRAGKSNQFPHSPTFHSGRKNKCCVR